MTVIVDIPKRTDKERGLLLSGLVVVGVETVVVVTLGHSTGSELVRKRRFQSPLYFCLDSHDIDLLPCHSMGMWTSSAFRLTSLPFLHSYGSPIPREL
jgi:hypothetical protein